MKHQVGNRRILSSQQRDNLLGEIPGNYFSCIEVERHSFELADAAGSPSGDYCSNCYRDGAYTFECDIDTMIESCVPFMTEKTGMTRDDAVSLMGAMLPNLKRWKSED